MDWLGETTRHEGCACSHAWMNTWLDGRRARMRVVMSVWMHALRLRCCEDVCLIVFLVILFVPLSLPLS